jgi:hypothetical protein
MQGDCQWIRHPTQCWFILMIKTCRYSEDCVQQGIIWMSDGARASIKCWCISHSMGPVRIRLFEEEWGVICPITVVSLAGQ